MTTTTTPTTSKNNGATRATFAAIPDTFADDRDVVATPATGVAALRGIFHTIEGELNATFAEREKEIRGLLVALLAREHVLLLGPAGTAKSALANTLCSAIDGAEFFQWLLTRFSTPEEIFGPVSLDGLKHDRFRRVTTGKLPECHVAFLDECYKANSAVLNSLLTAINERAFDNDGGRGAIPLETVVGASNELPEGPELAALHDRFLLRYWTTYTKTPDAFRRLLTGSEPAINARLAMADLKAAQAAVDAMPISNSAVDELFKLRGEIAAEGIGASDRRWRKAMRILKAAAWLEGAAEVTPEAFPILAHVLWETVEQIAKLTTVVSKYTSAELAEAQEVHDSMVELLGNLPPKGAENYAQQLVSITRELKRAGDRIATMHKNCTGAQSKAKIDVLRLAMAQRYKALRKDAAEALDL